MKWRLIVVGLSVAALLVPLPPAFVERHYSLALFPSLQPVVTSASNLTTVAWFDVLVVAISVTLLGLCGWDLATRRFGGAVVRIAWRLVTVAAVVYLAFLVTWGLNYRRTALREKVPFDPARITRAAALGLARETVVRLNDTYARAHADGWTGAREVDSRLAASFAGTTRALGLPGTTVPGRPKRSLLDLYFRRAGVAGMTDPFFLETLVASDTLPFERPQVMAHEWAHLAGITDEGEANFVGWLACVRAGAPEQYSGWLFLYGEVMGGLPIDAAREVSASLATGPRADLQAIRQRYEREVSPRLSTAGWQVYDQYLKANRVDAGTASYAQVVQLVLGTNLR